MLVSGVRRGVDAGVTLVRVEQVVGGVGDARVAVHVLQPHVGPGEGHAASRDPRVKATGREHPTLALGGKTHTHTHRGHSHTQGTLTQGTITQKGTITHTGDNHPLTGDNHPHRGQSHTGDNHTHTHTHREHTHREHTRKKGTITHTGNNHTGNTRKENTQETHFWSHPSFLCGAGVETCVHSHCDRNLLVACFELPSLQGCLLGNKRRVWLL